MRKALKVTGIIGSILIISAACSEIAEEVAPAEVEEVAPEVTEEDIAEEVEEEPEPEPVVMSPTPVTLGAGKHYAGEDIALGRYIVSTNENFGNLFITGASAFDMVNEILGTDTDFAVNNVTVELKDGDVIEISGLNNVLFTPR